MEKRLKGKRVLAFVAPIGFREEEIQQPRHILESQGTEFKVASVMQGTCSGILGARGKTELSLDQAQADDFDAVIMVGGADSLNTFWDSAELHRVVREAAESNKVIGGICLSGAMLARAGVAGGRHLTVCQTPRTLNELKKAGAR